MLKSSNFRSSQIYWFQGPDAVKTMLEGKGFNYEWMNEMEASKDAEDIIKEGNLDSAKNRREYLKKLKDHSLSIAGFAIRIIWFPQISAKFSDDIIDIFGDRLQIFSGSSIEDALHSFYLTRWNFGIFYHIACMGNWRNVVREQLDVVKNSNLDGLHISVSGTTEEVKELIIIIRESNLEYSIECQSDTLERYEFPAIELMEEWARDNQDGYILYFHTKGVSRPGDQIRRNWRRLMMHYVVSNWRENTEFLREGYDAVGIFWKNTPRISHFSGNFYLATSSFLITLEPFASYLSTFHWARSTAGIRYAAEFWIGSGNRNPRIASHFSIDENIALPDFWEQHYMQLPFSDGFSLSIRSGIEIEVVQNICGHGDIGIDGQLGYENLSVIPPMEFDQTLSAHANSVIIIRTDRPLSVMGFINGTSVRTDGVYFWIDSIFLDQLQYPLSSTKAALLMPGVHELRIRAVIRNDFCHTVWGFNLVD